MTKDPTTQELRVEQIQREREEHARAEQAVTPEGENTAIRRADKASYLRQKLEEQQAADEAAQ
jgi:hypothetical protein